MGFFNYANTCLTTTKSKILNIFYTPEDYLPSLLRG